MSSVSRSCSRSLKNEPFLPTIQEETELSFIVVVPANAVPGTVLSRKAPDGKDLDLTVPEGILPGTTLVLTQDAETRAWRCAVEAPAPPLTATTTGSKADRGVECEAESPPAAASTKSSVSVIVPDGATAGTKLMQKMPDGKELDLIVPDGVPAGSVLNLTQDPSTGKWACTVELKKPQTPAAVACKACEVPEAAADTSVSVVVPEGAEPGSILQAETRSGKVFDLTIPDGVSAGWLLSLTQDSRTNKWVCTAEPPVAAGKSAREEEKEEEDAELPQREEPATRPPARVAALVAAAEEELLVTPAVEQGEEPVVVPVNEEPERIDDGRHEEEQIKQNDCDDEDEEDDEDDDSEEDEDEEEEEEEDEKAPEVALLAAPSPSRQLRLQAAQQAWAAARAAVPPAAEGPPPPPASEGRGAAAAAEDAAAEDESTQAVEAEQQPLHRATSSEDRGLSVAPTAGHRERIAARDAAEEQREDRLSETALLPTMPLPPPPQTTATAAAKPVVVPTSIPPRYCSAHGTSAQRLKSVPKLWECAGCQMQVQTNYNDFTLCGPCSERQARCMICGGDAPTAGKYVPPCAMAAAASAPLQAKTASLGSAEQQLQENDEAEAVQNLWGSKDANSLGKAFDSEHKDGQQKPPFRLSSSAPYYPQQQPLHPSQTSSLGASWPSITSRPFPQETVPAVLPPHEGAQAGGMKVLSGLPTLGWPPLSKVQVDPPLLGPPQPMGAALATAGFASQRPGGAGGVGALRPMTYPAVAPGAFGTVHPPVLLNNSHSGGAMHASPFLMGGQFPLHQPVPVAVDDLSRSQRFPVPMA